MKHIHMMMAFITIALFLWQSYLLIIANKRLTKSVKIATHIVYTLLVVSGVMVVMPLLSTNAPLQWVAGKIILLVAAISASIKAFRSTATKEQSKAGIFIALVAYVGILALAFIKPSNFI